MLFRLGIFAAAMLATCGAATAQVKVRIGDLAQSLNEIASRVMIDQGIDRKYGLAAEYRAYPTLDGLFTAIRGKEVDVGFSGWTAIAQFRSKGFPVTLIFPVGRGVTVDVIVPTASPIKSIADLKGKKVGSFAGAAGTATVLFRVIASKFYGFDPGKTGPACSPPCSTRARLTLPLCLILSRPSLRAPASTGPSAISPTLTRPARATIFSGSATPRMTTSCGPSRKR
jgi:hypothetical protein